MTDKKTILTTMIYYTIIYLYFLLQTVHIYLQYAWTSV